MSSDIFRRRLYTSLNALVAICLAGLMIVTTPGVARAQKPSHSHSLSREKTQSLVKLINRERSEAGLPALTLREDISDVAELHAVDMIESGYFGHTSPAGATLADRLRSGGVEFAKAGENLAGCASVETAHRLLMASSSHRANILSPRFLELGVAVVGGGPYGMMIVEVFICEPLAVPVAGAMR